VGGEVGDERLGVDLLEDALALAPQGDAADRVAPLLVGFVVAIPDRLL
jgi:hypothetical protein